MYVLRRLLLMADEVPAGDKAVFAFLEMIALAFAFEGTSALLNGLGWQICAKAYVVAGAFFVAGIKWTRLKASLGIKVSLVIALAAFGLLNYWAGNPVGRYGSAVWVWWNGPHRRWFDRFSGALYLLVILVVLMLALGVILRLRQRPINQAPKGFLEYKLDAEVALSKMPAILAGLTAIMTEVGPSMEQHSEALAKGTTTAQHLKVSREASSSLDKYSSRLSRASVKYIRVGETFCTGLTGWSSWIEATRPSGLDPAFHAAMIEFGKTLHTSTEQMRGYVVSIGHMKGISRTLDAAAERHISALNPILGMTLRIKAACANSLRILEGLS
jgi:hypothetical protein